MEFAKSMSGHDRNQYYLIQKKDEEFAYLVNGVTKPLSKPKKKNLKHVQIIKKLPQEVLQILETEQTDIAIKKAIKVYEQMLQS